MEFISQNAESARSMALGRVSGCIEITLKTTGKPNGAWREKSEERRCVRTRVTLSSDSDRLPLPPSLGYSLSFPEFCPQSRRLETDLVQCPLSPTRCS